MFNLGKLLHLENGSRHERNCEEVHHDLNPWSSLDPWMSCKLFRGDPRRLLQAKGLVFQVKPLHIRINLWWRMTWGYSTTISAIGSMGQVESFSLRCNHEGECVPSLAQHFLFGQTFLQVCHWGRRWLPNEEQGGFICPMFHFSLVVYG